MRPRRYRSATALPTPPSTEQHQAVSALVTPGPLLPLTVNSQQAANALGISRATLWRLAKDGTIPAPVKIGRTTRWPYAELVAVLERAVQARDAAR